jgi:hypothetical protein
VNVRISKEAVGGQRLENRCEQADRCSVIYKSLSMRFKFLAATFFFVVTAVGCSFQVPVTQTTAPVEPVAQHPLPFKGKLVSGNANELPPAVAMSLSPDSPISFSYREELTHDEYHIPLAVTALDPVTYFGAPLGDYGVTAFASLSIFDGDRVLGDYTAKAFVSKSYTLYSEPTHKELEEAARSNVRQKIEQKLYSDQDRLAKAAASINASPP